MFCFKVVKTAHSWKYQTKCTQISKNSFHNNNNISTYSDIQTDGEAVYSIADDFDRANPNNINNNNHNDIISSNQNRMQLKCANSNDFLFIGLTQYGVNIKSNNNNNTCSINVNDCLVTVDYLSNECNGLNSCDIQLDAQFLHTCKNMSDYLSVAYECIPSSKRIDVCSNDETFIVDNNLSNSRFSNFFLTSPGYPNEYSSNLNNCSCKLEYVQIDDNPRSNKLNTELKQAKMNLVFKTFEFDLEEGESTHSDLTNTVYSEKCNKDVFSLNSFESNQNNMPSESLTLCGQHKEFKEFYMNGALVRFNLTSDDAITRRGFLIEIKPTPETVCPYGTERFDSKKCIKYFNEKNALNWADAVDSCKSKSGRLLTINDFVDNLKLNNLLRSKSVEVGSVWSAYQSNSRSSHEDINFLNVKRSTNSRCMSKSLNYWQDEPCNSQLAYICEFDPIYLNQKQLVSNDNRLIRVSCGSISSVYTTSSSSITSSTTTIVNSKKIPKRKQIANNKPIISWSSLIDKNINIMKTTRRQQPSLPPSTQLSNIISDLFTTTLKSAILIKEEPSDTLIIEQEKLIINKSEISTKPLNSTTLSNSATAGMISQELALIIAVICGFSIVFIVVNVFCIWNYYNRKLKAFIEKSETNTESNYRTSTLISRNAKLSSSSSNNRSMSTVDSYVKMLPNYETCVNVPNYLQFTTNSSPNSTACLLNSTNEQKIEILKNYFQKQSQDQNQQHYYETLSINKQNYNDYIMEGENNNFKQFFSNNNQFDSMIVLPVTSVPTSSSSSVHANSTVVLLNNNSLKQLQSNLMLSEIMASVSMPSPASNSQTKPLLTFSSNSDNSSSSSSSTSPAPAEL